MGRGWAGDGQRGLIGPTQVHGKSLAVGRQELGLCWAGAGQGLGRD